MNHKCILNNIVRIPRWGGISVIKSESVSDHVMSMIGLAVTLIPRINAYRKFYNYEIINLKELVYKIAIHDYDEAFYCDIPRPFKHHNKEVTQAIENTANTLMRQALNDDLVNDILHTKDNSIEGFWVMCLDLIQAGMKMTEEVNLGNKYMKSELVNPRDLLRGILSTIPGNEYQMDREVIKEFIDEFDVLLK